MVMCKVNFRLIAVKFIHLTLGIVRAVPRHCVLYPGICLTTKGKARKNISQGSRKVPFGHDSVCRHGRLFFLEVARTSCLTQYCAGGKIETNEMGRACGAYGVG